MSEEGDSTKVVSSESNWSKNSADSEDNTDSSQDSQDVKDKSVTKEAKNNADKEEEDDEVPEDSKEGSEKDSKAESKTIKSKSNDLNNEEVNKTKNENEDTDEKENDKSDTNDDEENIGSDKEDKESEKEKSSTKESKDKGVPLLDQPLELSGKRERKNVQRFHEDSPRERDSPKIDMPTGPGISLGDIPRVDASISRFKTEDLKVLHKFLFKNTGKTALIKKSIKKFNGFEFAKDSEEYTKRVAIALKFESKQLKSICEMLDLPKKDDDEENVEKIMEFLLEPKDTGKPVGGGRPKRTAAVRANNRGYSSHDDYSSDDKHKSRVRRGKGQRPNLKDESSSESDEDFNPSDDGLNDRPPVKRNRSVRKKPKSEEESDIESLSSDDSEAGQKNKKKKVIKVNNKTKGKAATPKKGRKPAPKKTPGRKKKAKESSEDEQAEQSDKEEEEGSSSEDEPLAKKAKSSQPPTDEEIKTYVKTILEGANLEEITMKTVCQQVYAHYPDFDLAHKKEFIKSTVKSLIST